MQDLIVTLNGLVPVPLEDQDGNSIVIKRVIGLLNVGPVASVGNITVQGDGTTSTNVFSIAPPVDQNSLMGVFTVPKGRTAILRTFSAGIVKSTGTETSAVIVGDISIPQYAEDGTVTHGPRISTIRYGLQRSGDSAIDADYVASYTLSELTDVVLKVTATSTGATAGTLVTFTLIPTTTGDYAQYLKGPAE